MNDEDCTPGNGGPTIGSHFRQYEKNDDRVQGMQENACDVIAKWISSPQVRVQTIGHIQRLPPITEIEDLGKTLQGHQLRILEDHRLIVENELAVKAGRIGKKR